MANLDSTKVVIRSSDGMYLSSDANGLRFVNDVYGAVLLDQEHKQLEQTVALLGRLTGLALKPIALKPEEVFETCDQCEQKVIPLAAFFDGTEFLCPKCREHRHLLKLDSRS